MNDLLQRLDPAAGVELDPRSLRAKVDQRLGVLGSVQPTRRRFGRPWLAAALGFAAIVVFFIPTFLSRQEPLIDYLATAERLADLPGVQSVVVESEGGGVRTMAVDGDQIWVTSALARRLVRVDARTNRVEASYPIDAYVEGVVVGGGYLWLLSYDDGGEVLRFDPTAEALDLTVPLGAEPWHAARWYDDHLWVSTSDSRILHVSVDGEITSTQAGELKGSAFGALWVIDPATNVLGNLTAEGPGEIAIPMGNLEVREVIEAGGYLWVLGGDFTTLGVVHRYDPRGGPPTVIDVGFGAHDLVEAGESVWVTSHWDHTLTRIDPATAEVRGVTPLPGRLGAMASADGSLWVSLYQPGLLVRIDPAAQLMNIGPVVVDEVVNGYRLLCTGGGEGPTVLLDPEWWIGPGSWSVIQAELSTDALVCSHGKVDDRDADAKVANLVSVLEQFHVEGPYLLVAHGTGVLPTRLLANSLGDQVAAVVLVDPVAESFADLARELAGQPVTLELGDTAVDLDRLPTFGQVPLVVIGHAPSATFLSKRFVSGTSRAVARQLNDAWQEGLRFYAGLSSRSQLVTAAESGHFVIWDRPDRVVEVVRGLLRRQS